MVSGSTSRNTLELAASHRLPFARPAALGIVAHSQVQYEGFDPALHALLLGPHGALCYAILLPGQNSGFRAGCRPNSIRENINIGSPAGIRPDGGPILRLPD